MGISLIKKRPPLQDYHRALCKGLLWGPRRRWFVLSGVPLYRAEPSRGGGYSYSIVRAHAPVP